MLENSASNTTRKYHATDFLHSDVAFARALPCFVASTYTHGHTECNESTFQRQNVRNERKIRQKDVFHVKIIEKYHAASKNPTSRGAKCGTFLSKNTTRNLKFHENPTPRWDFLKSHEVEPHVWEKLWSPKLTGASQQSTTKSIYGFTSSQHLSFLLNFI